METNNKEIGVYSIYELGSGYNSLLLFDGDLAAIKYFMMFLYDVVNERYNPFSNNYTLYKIGTYDPVEPIVYNFNDGPQLKMLGSYVRRFGKYDDGELKSYGRLLHDFEIYINGSDEHDEF